MRIKFFSVKLLILVLFMNFNCQKHQERNAFGEDLQFLKQYITPIVLKQGQQQVIVSSEFQGRVFSSTSKGLVGPSYGWFNKDLFINDNALQSISSVGGASRIWFGPDQGENNVFVDVNEITKEVLRAAPKDLDTLPFYIFEKSESAVTLGSKMHIKNLKGFDFYVDIKRSIKLLSEADIASNLNISLNSAVDFVAFSAETQMINVGNENWTKAKGIISLWELGCMEPTPNTTAVIPLKGEINQATVYFTPIDSTRIKIENNTLFYKADAEYLNKIGTPPENTLPYFGSYSPELNLLTVVRFSFTGEQDYVNAVPDNTAPYKGDVINIFNDGTWGDIGPFGPFYELETSSPAKALKVGESLTHVHETYHFEGSKAELNKISVDVFGVNLDVVENALP